MSSHETLRTKFERFPKTTRVAVSGMALSLSLTFAACGSSEGRFAKTQIEKMGTVLSISDPENFSGKGYKSGQGKEVIIIRSKNTENFTSDAVIRNIFNSVEKIANQGLTIPFILKAPSGETEQFDLVVNPSPSKNHVFIIEDKQSDVGADLGVANLPAAVTVLNPNGDGNSESISLLASYAGDIRFGYGIKADFVNSVVEITNNATSLSLGPKSTEYIDQSAPTEQDKEGFRLVFIKIGTEVFSNSLALMVGLKQKGMSYAEYSEIAKLQELQEYVSLGFTVPYLIFDQEFYDSTSIEN
ncbi:hypothetical protein M1307_03865 [Patescibacteria group bacterium]|nr:hypothetical protein [Patescibacteria group bacterium]